MSTNFLQMNKQFGYYLQITKEVQNVTLSNELLTFEIRDIRFINWQVKLSSGISMTFTSFLDIRIWWAY